MAKTTCHSERNRELHRGVLWGRMQADLNKTQGKKGMFQNAPADTNILRILEGTL